MSKKWEANYIKAFCLPLLLFSIVATSSKAQRAFLRKDDPKVTALMQQAEVLSSFAIKVNAECSEKSLEDTWKELQEYLQQNKENGNQYCKFDDMDLLFEDFKEIVEDLENCNLQLDSYIAITSYSCIHLYILICSRCPKSLPCTLVLLLDDNRGSAAKWRSLCLDEFCSLCKIVMKGKCLMLVLFYVGKCGPCFSSEP